MTQPDFDQLLNALTGKCITVIRDGTETAIEVEFATPEERRRFFAKLGKGKMLDWMDRMCARLVKHHQLIGQLRDEGLWDDAKVMDFLVRKSKEPQQPVVEMTEPTIDKRTPTAQKPTPSRTSNPLKQPLKILLDDLDRIFAEHEEVGDTAVQQRMREAIWKGFIQPESGYKLPAGFGMFSKVGDKKVRNAVRRFLTQLKVMRASALLKTKEARLLAFQDSNVESKEGNTYDEYFGNTEGL